MYPGRATCIRIWIQVDTCRGDNSFVADTGFVTCRWQQGHKWIQVDATCILVSGLHVSGVNAVLHSHASTIITQRLHLVNVFVTNSLTFDCSIVYFVTIVVLQPGKLVSSSSQHGEADGTTINTPVLTDRSPLIKNATSPPPIIADATAFDNVAIAEPPQETTSVSGHMTDSLAEIEEGSVVGKDVSSTARNTTNKKRKVLSIVR